MQKEYDSVCKLGHDLIHLTVTGDDTTKLEQSLEAINESWINLNEVVRKYC